MKVHHFTHVGNYRPQNEDCYHVDEVRGVFVVADGMGGHAAGEVASRKTCEVLAEKLGTFPPLELYRHADPGMSADDKAARLADAVRDANSAVYKHASRTPGCRGMGTTVVAAALATPPDVDGASIIIAHVGDSRAYLLRRGDFHQLTVDHTYASAHRACGKTEAEIAEMGDAANTLTDAVGVDKSTNISCQPWALRPGDVFLLCSDGLYNEVPPEELARLLHEGAKQPDGGAGALLEAALKGCGGIGGRDNITGIVVRM